MSINTYHFRIHTPFGYYISKTHIHLVHFTFFTILNFGGKDNPNQSRKRKRKPYPIPYTKKERKQNMVVVVTSSFLGIILLIGYLSYKPLKPRTPQNGRRWKTGAKIFFVFFGLQVKCDRCCIFTRKSKLIVGLSA